MTLSTLLQGITYTSPSAPALLAGCEVDHITEDSRAVKPGTLFVALRGVHADGHRFVPAAIEAGARAVLVETLPEEQRTDVAYIVVVLRPSAWLACSALHGHPSQAMQVVGVYGDEWEDNHRHAALPPLPCCGLSLWPAEYGM